MSGNSWTWAFVCVLTMAGLLGGAQASAAPAYGGKINFVIILVDDLGWTDLTCQGSRYFETPHVDRLAAQGMRFTDGYAACAVSNPDYTVKPSPERIQGGSRRR